MSYFGTAQQSWLDIAETCKPMIHRRMVNSVAIVKMVADKDAFQGWTTRHADHPDSFFERSFSEGDSFVLDFGEHQVGYLLLSLALQGIAMGGPLRLRMVFGEVPSEIAQPFDPFTGSLSRGWLQDEIITIDTLPQTIRLQRRYAFRYLKCEVLACSFDYRFRFNDIQCEAVTSAPKAIDTFDRGRIPAPLREIDRVSLRTLQNCMQTVLEDGPKRDRRLWLADSPLMAQVIYHTFQNTDLYKRCLHLFAGLAHDDGRLPACVYERPAPHRGDEFILDFAVMFAAYLHDYARNSGDWETAERLWPVARRQLDFAMAYLDDRGCFRDLGKWWIFIDWQPALDKHAAMQGLFIYAFQEACALAGALSRQSEIATIRDRLKLMRKAALDFRAAYSPGFFVSGPQKQVSWASQVWMIKAGMVKREEAIHILHRLGEVVDAVRPATPFIYHYAAEAMLMNGMIPEATALIQRYWGKMLDYGATTFWEVFNPEDHFESPYGNHHLNSYCHSWSCTPAYLIRKYLLT